MQETSQLFSMGQMQQAANSWQEKDILNAESPQHVAS
jgi:hypothetical protein